MRAITYRILKFESMIEKPIVENHTLFAVITFSKVGSFPYINFIVITFIVSHLHKDFHQDNMSFVCLQFYKHNCLNTLAGNICFHIQVKNQ